MAQGLITNDGRILMAKLLLGSDIEGITHCAIGEGDGTFTDPLSPPDPTVTQTSLKGEKARKRYYKRSFLIEDAEGPINILGTKYSETTTPSNIIGLFFKFTEAEAVGVAIKEYGFFGGDVSYVAGVEGDLALNGVYHETMNPSGEVFSSGHLVEVRNMTDYNKSSDTSFEIIGAIKI